MLLDRSAPYLRIAAALVCGLSLIARSPAQTDNFDDGDDIGWVRCTNYPSTYSFPADVFGGHAYRLQASPKTGAPDPLARAFSVITNRTYTNFYAAVDVVSWNTNQDCEEVVGILARANNLSDILAGTPSAIAFNARLHMKRSYSGPNNTGPLGARDQMSIYSFLNAGGTLALNAPVAFTFTTTITGFRWVPGHPYRLVFTCTNNPTSGLDTFTGMIYDLEDLTRPLLSMTGDTSYGGGNAAVAPPYGFLGVFALKLLNPDYDPTLDVTFDNFIASETPPAGPSAAAIAHPVIAAPQVVNRSPTSFANFYPASGGIAFNATTLSTTNAINSGAIRLFLNSVDVSSGLSISGFTTNLMVSYQGLASNAVYDARIELQDVIGRRTTNIFTFDTFSDAYLASAGAKNIECEDYDYSGGQFIPTDPVPPSGYATNDTSFSNPFNGNGVGYLDLVGTAGLDFFDYDSTPSRSYERQFRYYDPVGTQQGDLADVVESSTGSSFSSLANLLAEQSYDTQRSKYSNLDPGLQEYNVRRVEGGEWLNYTRVFSGSNFYNVYLRVACGLAQPVRLDRIGSGPTTNFLGSFNIPSTFFLNNYRYVPLLDSNGKLAVINLSGTNILRLTMDSPQSDGTKQGLAMNYMAFVPALLLESASQVAGPYTIETNASVEPGTRRITVPVNGSARFYRCRWDHVVRITAVSVVGGSVLFNYQ